MAEFNFLSMIYGDPTYSHRNNIETLLVAVTCLNVFISIFILYKAAGAQVMPLTVNATSCGFDSHLGKWKI